MKVSVITVVFNDVRGIERTMKAVQSQTHGDIEHIIIDGASTDGTAAVIERLKCENTVVISEPDEGIYDAMNKGLKLVTGDVFHFLNAADKYFDPQVLADVNSVFEGADIDLAYGNNAHFDQAGRIIRYWPARAMRGWRLFLGWLPAHPALFARSALIEQFGGFDTRYKIAADVDIMLRWLRAPNLKIEAIDRDVTLMEAGGVSNASIGGIMFAWREVTGIWLGINPVAALIAPNLKILYKVVQLAKGRAIRNG